MKKRIFSVLLCLVMALPMLVACESSGGSKIRLNGTPMTLTIYAITDEKTTEDGIKQAEKAINEITEYDFTTHVVLKLFTADEYADALEDDLAVAKRNFVAPAETTTEAEESDTADTEEGEEEEEEETTESRVYVERDEIEYPEIDGAQVDILLITSIDQFNSLVANGDIQPLDGELQDASRIIKKFVNPSMMSAGASSLGVQYASPNNRAVGEYEYLLRRRDLVDAYYYDPDEIHTLLQLEEYVNDVRALNPEVTPVLDTYGVAPLAVSMTDDPLSLFGSYVGYNVIAATNAAPRVLVSNARYRNEYSFLRTATDSGAIVAGETADDYDAAAVFVKGDCTLPEKYADKYYVNVYKYPTMTNENVYDGMFAVSTYSKSLSRSMQIITYLTTNAKFRNIFQYGMREENYNIDKNDFVTILNDEYVMDPKYTGNMFLLYQNDRMTEDELAFSADNWALAKKQIVETVASPYLGFSAVSTNVTFADTSGMAEAPYTTAEIMKQVSALSDQYKEKIAAYTAANGGLSDFLSAMGEEMSQNEFVKIATNINYVNSPYAKYAEWYKQRFSESN